MHKVAPHLRDRLYDKVNFIFKNDCIRNFRKLLPKNISNGAS